MHYILVGKRDGKLVMKQKINVGLKKTDLIDIL